MRFSHWLKTLASAAVLSATAGPALAQNAGYPGTGQPTFQPAYGTNDPGVMYPQGVPQGYNPYPAISPYNMGNVAWDQTFRDNDGLWYERIMNTNREYFGSISVIHSTIKNPGNHELGSPHIPFDNVTGGLVGYVIPTYDQGSSPGGTTTTAGAVTVGTPHSSYVLDPRVIPYPLYLPTFTYQFDNHLFPIRGMDQFGNYKSTGLQANWGFFNEDGSGLSVGGFWTGVSTQDFTMGADTINGIKINQTIIQSSDGRLLFTRNGALPLAWGDVEVSVPGDNNFTVGLGSAKYDLYYHFDTKTSAIGADSNIYFAPTVQRNAMKIRPLVGGRYMMVNDQFSLRGIDSGFSYTVTSTAGGTGGGGGATGGTTGNTYRPDPGSLAVAHDMYEATVYNNVRTNLAGPQAGFRCDFGEGDGFRLWGQSVVGLMANREDYILSGNNIGDERGLLASGSGLDMLTSDARFASTRSVSHVSPLFEQSINADMKLLQYIPGVRRLPGVEDCVFKIGYTATVVGQVARAADSIDWRGFPYFPSISPGRETWWMSRWNFGIEKRF